MRAVGDVLTVITQTGKKAGETRGNTRTFMWYDEERFFADDELALLIRVLVKPNWKGRAFQTNLYIPRRNQPLSSPRKIHYSEDTCISPLFFRQQIHQNRRRFAPGAFSIMKSGGQESKHQSN